MAELTTFDIVFPIGLGLIFGMMRYSRYTQTDHTNAIKLSAIDAVKGTFGASIIIIAYKTLGIL